MGNSPQDRENGEMTISPILKPLTSEPTATISPTAS